MHEKWTVYCPQDTDKTTFTLSEVSVTYTVHLEL